jgi:hypothetical protein
MNNVDKIDKAIMVAGRVRFANGTARFITAVSRPHKRQFLFWMDGVNLYLTHQELLTVKAYTGAYLDTDLFYRLHNVMELERFDSLLLCLTQKEV